MVYTNGSGGEREFHPNNRFRWCRLYLPLCLPGVAIVPANTRDVVRRLDQQGAIERRQKKGVIIRQPSRKEVIDICDARIALELFAVSRAVDRITDQDLDELADIARRHDQCRIHK